MPAGEPRFPECEPGEGKTVTDLPDEVIEAVVIPQGDVLFGDTEEGRTQNRRVVITVEIA